MMAIRPCIKLDYVKKKGTSEVCFFRGAFVV